MAQCSLVFAARPRAYKTDERKVLQVIARLRGVPLKWAKAIALDENHPLRKDWKGFKATLNGMYEDHNAA